MMLVILCVLFQGVFRLRSTPVTVSSEGDMTVVNVSCSPPHDERIDIAEQIMKKIEVNIENIEVESKTSDKDGTGYYFNNPGWSNSVVNVRNMLYRNVNSTKNGGAIFFGNINELKISNNTFIDTFATESGAMIINKTNNFEMDGVNAQNTKAVNGFAGFGSIQNGINARVKNGVFENGSAIFGGAFYVNNQVLTEFDNCVFNSFSSTNEGGTLYSKSSGDTNIYNSKVSNSFSKTKGGTASFSQTSFNIKNLTILNSSSINEGGSIFANAFTLGSIEDSNIEDSFSSNSGGVASLSGTNFSVKRTSIKNSKGADGGSFYFSSLNAFEADDLDVQNSSSSSGYGGSLFLAANIVMINNSDFFNCSSTNSGGVLFSQNSKIIQIYNTRISNSTSNSQGGSLYVTVPNNGIIEMVGSSFMNSKATSQGGSIYFSIHYNTYISDCLFYNCVSSSFGGAIFINSFPSSRPPMRICDTQFVLCGANNDGGAIHLSSGQYFRINMTRVCAQKNYIISSGNGVFMILTGYQSSDSYITEIGYLSCSNHEGVNGNSNLYLSKNYHNLYNNNFSHNCLPSYSAFNLVDSYKSLIQFSQISNNSSPTYITYIQASTHIHKFDYNNFIRNSSPSSTISGNQMSGHYYLTYSFCIFQFNTGISVKENNGYYFSLNSCYFYNPSGTNYAGQAQTVAITIGSTETYAYTFNLLNTYYCEAQEGYNQLDLPCQTIPPIPTTFNPNDFLQPSPTACGFSVNSGLFLLTSVYHIITLSIFLSTLQ